MLMQSVSECAVHDNKSNWQWKIDPHQPSRCLGMQRQLYHYPPLPGCCQNSNACFWLIIKAIFYSVFPYGLAEGKKTTHLSTFFFPLFNETSTSLLSLSIGCVLSFQSMCSFLFCFLAQFWNIKRFPFSHLVPECDVKVDQHGMRSEVWDGGGSLGIEPTPVEFKNMGRNGEILCIIRDNSGEKQVAVPFLTGLPVFMQEWKWLEGGHKMGLGSKTWAGAGSAVMGGPPLQTQGHIPWRNWLNAMPIKGGSFMHHWPSWHPYSHTVMKLLLRPWMKFCWSVGCAVQTWFFFFIQLLLLLGFVAYGSRVLCPYMEKIWLFVSTEMKRSNSDSQ